MRMDRAMSSISRGRSGSIPRAFFSAFTLCFSTLDTLDTLDAMFDPPEAKLYVATAGIYMFY